MAWSVYGNEFLAGELANTNMFCTVEPNKDLILRAMRTWLIFYNDPTFTNLTAKLYSNDTSSGINACGELIANSTTTLTKAQILTLDNGVKEIYFEFDDVPLDSETKYNFVINGTGYSYSAGSHIAWRKGWPKPVYVWDEPVQINLYRAPPELYIIGADF